jgi:hypothetical protein
MAYNEGSLTLLKTSNKNIPIQLFDDDGSENNSKNCEMQKERIETACPRVGNDSAMSNSKQQGQSPS